jgi:two-component system cell cycle sensor histidine kinase/response regulator CckA
MNLITNASEALGDREGTISVSVAHVRPGKASLAGAAANLLEGDYLKLEVSDTGCGMTEKIRSKIFDPFFTTKFTGRGLGLAAVQGIIRGHGGTIDIVSTSGQGSRFEILLPCTSQPARDTRDAAVTASSDGAGNVAATILVIEDEDPLRLAVSKMLRKEGFSTIEAADGSNGVDLFRASALDIDVVLLDVTLPGLSGREVLSEVRRIPPDVKVILTTAYSQDSTLAAVGGQEPWLYIRKPYQLSQLADLLRNACPRQQASGRAAN